MMPHREVGRFTIKDPGRAEITLELLLPEHTLEEIADERREHIVELAVGLIVLPGYLHWFWTFVPITLLLIVWVFSRREYIEHTLVSKQIVIGPEHQHLQYIVIRRGRWRNPEPHPEVKKTIPLSSIYEIKTEVTDHCSTTIKYARFRRLTIDGIRLDLDEDLPTEGIHELTQHIRTAVVDTREQDLPARSPLSVLASRVWAALKKLGYYTVMAVFVAYTVFQYAIVAIVIIIALYNMILCILEP